MSALCLKCLFSDLLEEKGFFLFIYTVKFLGWFKDQKEAKAESNITKQQYVTLAILNIQYGFKLQSY